MDHLIEKHLHHKKPNLLLEKVIDCTEEGLQASFFLDEEHPWLKGHFEGLPIFPGTQMMELLVQAAGIHMAEFYFPNHREDKLSVGVFRKCTQAKFINFARPGQEIIANIRASDRIDNLHTYSGRVTNSKCEKLMQAKFSLITIPEATLRGSMCYWDPF